MSMKSKALAEEGTPIYVTRFDGVRVPATDYHPVWLDNLADDVTIEGSAMNGVAQGAEAVRSIVTRIRALYDSQEFNFAGPYGENGFLEDYTAWVVASRSATSSWSPATTPGRRSTSWPTTGREHTAPLVPADRRPLRRHRLRRVLRDQRRLKPRLREPPRLLPVRRRAPALARLQAAYGCWSPRLR